MSKAWFRWAALPVRIFIGVYLVASGFPILTDNVMRDNAVHVLAELGIPLAGAVVFGVGGIAVLAGLAITVGAYTKTAAWFVIFSVGAHLLFAMVRGGFPEPLPGLTMPIPDMGSSLLILMGMLALLISGGGAFSFDATRYQGQLPEPPYKEDSLVHALTFFPGLYIAIVGIPILMNGEVRAETVDVLSAIGIPLAEIVVFGVGGIAAIGGVMLVLGIFPYVAALLQIFSIGSHVLFASATTTGTFPVPADGTLPIPDMQASILLLGLMFGALIASGGRYLEKRATRLNLLNLLVPIKEGEVAKVRELLAEIDRDMTRNQYIRFPESELTHFARFFITRDEKPRLGFGATYNGNLKPYTDELLKIGPGLEELWGRCEGFTSRERFYDFVKANAYPSGMVFFGFKGVTVKQVRAWIALREKINSMIGTHYLGLGDLLDKVEAVRSKQGFIAVYTKLIQRWRENFVEVVRRIVVPPVQEFARFLGNRDVAEDWSRMTTNFDGDIEKRKRELDAILELEATENQHAQTTMTVMADLKPGRMNQVRFLFAIAPPILEYSWNPGNFAGVYSLHSFRFALIDGGTRVWFMSNYNGSAENYFSDFIDKLNWGINAAYTHCIDYPEGGMNQQDAFAYWIRTRQMPALVYYSAYPDNGIHKTLKDREIAQILGTGFDRAEAERLLELL